MSAILNQIADYTKIRYEKIMAERSFEDVKAKALQLPKGDFSFEKTLKTDGLSFICEVKKPLPRRA